MGCDGGTIPKRDELVRVKKKPEQKDKDAEREFRWLHCALTQQRLQEPIVMCALGRLYSKQSVIEQLLDKQKMPESSQHIRSLKDIKTLKLTPNPAYTDADKTEGLLDTRHAPYICSLTGLEMSGRFRFIALWSCGCVMSERAPKQIGNKTSTCPLCQTPFGIEDLIILNGNEEDLELMKAKMEMRAEKRKSAKKEKKEKKVEKIKEDSNTKEQALIPTSKQDVQVPTTSKLAIAETNGKQSINVNGAATSKTKMIAKRLGATTDAMQDPELKRLKTDYSVAKDPKATDVYKSLFTSHKTEQEQERAHWVTYNPFYN